MLKQINRYWMDENNNRWDCGIYTKEQAEDFSKSLVNCYNCCNCMNCNNCCNCNYCENCHNCGYCNNCHYCNNCENCYYCYYSSNCRDCHSCRNCNNCNKCHDCHNCNNCRYCYNCSNCRDCNNCYNCCYYKQNPQRYTTGKVGSRNDQTTFYYGETKNNEKEIQVVCGCFKGNLEEFEEAVLETHKDNDFYRKQYLKEIEKVKVLFDLEIE